METKQETLEEAARDYIKGDDLSTFSQKAFFIAGAKWHARRMEEILRKAYFDRIDDIDVDGYWISDPEKDLEMLIEQFKKQ